MFAVFEKHFRRDAALSCPKSKVPFGQIDDPRLKELFLRFGGASFNRGLYRVMTADIVEAAHALIAHAFPECASQAKAFGYDWGGRIFALELDRLEEGLPAIMLFEPGTGEALEIPANLVTFHENELINNSEAALGVSFHKQWLATGGAAPKYDQCIGYQRPLFLGGEDVVENLELSDLDVYWTLSGQMIQQTRGLPPGTRVRFSLND